MEALYSKLYDKYTKLKNKKLSEFDQLNKDQEEKFMTYLSAAEELIEHLKSENDQLREQANELRSEVALIRLSKDRQVADYQRLLMEESKKNEALSEEVEKLQKMYQEGDFDDPVNNDNNTPDDDQFIAVSDSSTRKKTGKRARLSASGKSIISTPCGNSKDNSEVRESAKKLCKETASILGLECSAETNDQPGVGMQEGHSNWLVQALFEYLLGMKLSTDSQTGQVCISALHPSSGYSFRLTWVSKAPGEEAELLYHVLSLGTFERVAPEWMKEDIIFSITMCPIFFHRLSDVVKLNLGKGM